MEKFEAVTANGTSSGQSYGARQSSDERADEAFLQAHSTKLGDRADLNIFPHQRHTRRSDIPRPKEPLRRTRGMISRKQKRRVPEHSASKITLREHADGSHSGTRVDVLNESRSTVLLPTSFGKRPAPVHRIPLFFIFSLSSGT